MSAHSSLDELQEHHKLPHTYEEWSNGPASVILAGVGGFEVCWTYLNSHECKRCIIVQHFVKRRHGEEVEALRGT